ncbi:MAG: alpha/beta hydrolase [Mycobacterium sp.]
MFGLPPLDAALAFTDTAARLPVVGRHLEPLGTLTAAGAFGSRVLPGMIAGMWKPKAPRPVDLEAPDESSIVWASDPVPPMLRAWDQRRQFLYRSNVAYGSAPGQLLDVWRRKDLPAGPAPVLVFLPGGGWIHGSRVMQGYALMSALASQGWVCLSIDYRVAPQHRWPRHVQDVKAAIAWARRHVHTVGGDPGFVAVAGASAGGHLAALTGLTPGEYATELPAGTDTSVDAVVGIYGRYDWVDRSTSERDEFVRFLERIVVRDRIEARAEVFEQASPILRVRADAPPFLVVHGTGDRVIPVAQARDFVKRLGAVSRSGVEYLELPGAGHAFDLTDGRRTGTAVAAIGEFLQRTHDDHLAGAPRRVG